MAKTQGCPDARVHEAHTWSTVARGRRHNIEQRSCPGRVKCDECGKNVFTSTATPKPGSGWVCTGRCR